MNNVSKSFDDSFQALKNVTLKFSPGEITALIGHNGAGKSTLLSILAGETLPTSGDISVYGNDNPFLLHQMIGFCKQDNFLWPDLTAKEHLNIFGGMRCTDRKSHDKIVQEWLESVDLAIAKDDYSSTFSGGMKRRLSVALATIGDRPFVILDEPTDEMVSSIHMCYFPPQSLFRFPVLLVIITLTLNFLYSLYIGSCQSSVCLETS